jgi:hypothetical protein
MAQTLEETADPRGVGAGLDGYPHPLDLREVPLERLGAGAHLALFDHLTSFGIQQAQRRLFLSPKRLRQ